MFQAIDFVLRNFLLLVISLLSEWSNENTAINISLQYISTQVEVMNVTVDKTTDTNTGNATYTYLIFY